jgi:cytidine deaminase
MSNLSHRLQKILELAKKVSKDSNYRYKLGAVIFNSGKIIAIGNNSVKTNPRLSKIFRHATIHAECDAIFHCVSPQKLKGASIFVVRENNSGHPDMAKPCDMCVTVMYKHGIKTAYWTIPTFPYWASAKVEDMYKVINHENVYETNGRFVL